MEDERHRIRAQKKLIKVIFPNGKVFCYNNTTSTMIDVLKEIGADRFPDIKMDLCHLPLLSKEIYPKYKEWMKPVCDGWYINAQSNSDNKYMQLRSINDQLSLGLTIEMGTDFEIQDRLVREKKSRTKDKLLVKFPDGEYIANESALDTYLETVWKLGIDDIMRKGLTWTGKDLITTTKITNNQVQIDEHRWIIVPNTTKDKAKLLRVIKAMLHINMEITVI